MYSNLRITKLTDGFKRHPATIANKPVINYSVWKILCSSCRVDNYIEAEDFLVASNEVKEKN
jgi:recombinational DNA repair protein RecT